MLGQVEVCCILSWCQECHGFIVNQSVSSTPLPQPQRSMRHVCLGMYVVLGMYAALWKRLHGEVWPFFDGGVENFALHHCGHCP